MVVKKLTIRWPSILRQSSEEKVTQLMSRAGTPRKCSQVVE